MTEEIIFCNNMQSYYRPRFTVSYVAACRQTNVLIRSGASRDIPTWAIYNDYDDAFTNVILDAHAPTELRDTALKKFDRAPKGGIGDVKLTQDMPVIFKRGFSAFENKNLLAELERQGVKKIHMAGFSAEDCVAATAIDASRYGFETTLVKDAVFGWGPSRALHETTLRQFLKMKFHEMGLSSVSDYAALEKIEIVSGSDVLKNKPTRSPQFVLPVRANDMFIPA